VDVKAGTKVVGAELERRNAATEGVIAEHKTLHWPKSEAVGRKTPSIGEWSGPDGGVPAEEHRRSLWARGEKKRGLHGYSGNNTPFSEGGDEVGRSRQGILCNQSSGRRGAAQTGFRQIYHLWCKGTIA